MVLIGLTVNLHVDGIYRVYSLLTCGRYLESLQCTHVCMVFREFTVYSRVDGTERVDSLLTCGLYLEN
jgi:hypothetical protein